MKTEFDYYGTIFTIHWDGGQTVNSYLGDELVGSVSFRKEIPTVGDFQELMDKLEDSPDTHQLIIGG